MILRLLKSDRLLRPADFRNVYADGRRFDGRLMTVFIKPATGEKHRVGITASKKLSTKAHDRNRAKRLLREAFRLNKPLLVELEGKYDWVLNARLGLLEVKLDEPLAELRGIIEKVKKIRPEKGGTTSS